MSNMTKTFRDTARAIVAARDNNLLDYGADEQINLATEALDVFHARRPLQAVAGRALDLAGFGEATIHFESTDLDKRYLLVTEVGAALGMEPWKACKWARQRWEWAVLDQRRDDEENGRLGYEYLDDHVDLRVLFYADDVPDAKPDANGKKWEHYGEWLISDSVMLSFLMDSPWGHEFFKNARDHMGIAFRSTFGANVKDERDQEVLNSLFGTDLSEEEALRKAKRGPAVEDGDA